MTSISKNPDVVAKLKKYDITFNGAVQLGFANVRPPLVLETCVQMRQGVYDVEGIGAYTYLGGRNSIFRHVSKIGRFCSIAGNIHCGAMEHPTTHVSTHPLFYSNCISQFASLAQYYEQGDNLRRMREAGKAFNAVLDKRGQRITIGNDVWIGEGVFIRRGVTIGDGAIVASHSVVSGNVEPYTIVGGAPARVIRQRFGVKVTARLLDLQWWRYGLSIFEGVETQNTEAALERMEDNVRTGIAKIFEPTRVVLESDDTVRVLEPEAAA